MPYQKELNIALAAVEKAMKLSLCVERRLKKISVIEKQDRSPVTIADFGSQAVINMLVVEAFPEDVVVGEETAENLRNDQNLSNQVLELVRYAGLTATPNRIITCIGSSTESAAFSDRFWVVDPIDGTKGFLRGDQYAIALGLVEQGEVVLGVLGCPNLPARLDRPEDEIGCILYATKGSGTWMRIFQSKADLRVFVDSVADSRCAKFCESFEKAHAAHETHQRILASLGITTASLRMDSQVKYAAVARGDASIYLRLPRKKDYQEKIWDHAPGSIIVKEAGGEVTDFKGRALDFSTGKTLRNNSGIVATNGHLHRRVLDAISRVIN
ncbi:MAG: 3'(2'),5'-bisphosphate nucleotidase [Deltaproteobacteria bacterium]|nr:3'(2'),5'-bisphosphate nucleotidase [Deltaproteobacteria bacterium]MBW2151320.1 3'(2'),5'-bisphosphate nucleotidase [Deltaproteobacteria bacterium]